MTSDGPDRPRLRLVHDARDAADDGPVGLGDDSVDDEDAESPAPGAPHPLTPRFVVVALIAFQALAAASYLGKYVELTRGGGVSPAAAVLAVPGSLALWLGALALAWRPRLARTPNLVAAVALGLSVPAWGLSYGWTWPMAFGAMLGLAGAWFARDSAREPGEAASEPVDDGSRP